VEFAFSLFDTRDELTEGLDQRLEAVRVVLKQSAHRAVSPQAMGKLAQFAMIGASRLRRLALSANPARHDDARLSTTVALVGRLVDILAPYRRFDSFTSDDAPRLQALADQISKLQEKLHARNGKRVIQPLRTPSDGPLILLGLEQTLDLLRMSLFPRLVNRSRSTKSTPRPLSRSCSCPSPKCPNELPPNSESYKQTPASARSAKGVESFLRFRMSNVAAHHK